jgi:hypothetical protein
MERRFVDSKERSVWSALKGVRVHPTLRGLALSQPENPAFAGLKRCYLWNEVTFRDRYWWAADATGNALRCEG